MIYEKWGGYGNSERRTQLWRQVVLPPGEARSDVWQMMEFSKRFTLGEVWGEQPVPGLEAEGFEKGKLPDVLADAERRWATSRTDHALRRALRHAGEPEGRSGPTRSRPGKPNSTVDRRRHRLVPGEGALRGVRRVRPGPRPRPRPLRRLPRATTCAACAGRWWNGQGDPLALQRAVRPLRQARARASTSTATAMKKLPAGDLDRRPKPGEPVALAGKAKIFFRPWQEPPEIARTPTTTSGSAPAACWSTGTPAP